MSVAFVRDCVVSVLCALDFTVPPVFRPSMSCWLAAVNYRLEEGTLEMDSRTGALRFRIAMPIIKDHPSACSMVKYLVGCARYNCGLLRGAAMRFQAAWLAAAMSGEPPSLAQAAIAARCVDGINGQLVGPAAPSQPPGDGSPASASSPSAGSGGGTHEITETSSTSDASEHSAPSTVAQLVAPYGGARGAPTPFNSPAPVPM